MGFTPLPGSCLCRNVRFEIIENPITVYACHCTDCQIVSGAGFTLSAVVPREAVRLLRGEPVALERPNAAGETKTIFHCGACWTSLWGVPVEAPNLLNLRVGTLEDAKTLEPVGHLFTRSAQAWIAIPEDALTHEAEPDDMLPMVRAWQERAIPR